ncbi:MAG: MoaD/ThiS family protein [Candidatus Binatia bacterium]
MRICVDFMGSFDLDFGAATVDIVIESPATVATLLDHLAAHSVAGRRLRQALTGGSSPRRRYILVSLDYVMLAPDTALETPLHNEARLCFATPMVGG